jgi:hypothetical protein
LKREEEERQRQDSNNLGEEKQPDLEPLLDEPDFWTPELVMESFDGISTSVDLLEQYRIRTLRYIQRLTRLLVQENKQGEKNFVIRVLHRDGLDLDKVSSAIEEFQEVMTNVTIFFHELADSANMSAQIEPIITQELKLTKEIMEFKKAIESKDVLSKMNVIIQDLKEKGKDLQKTVQKTRDAVNISFYYFLFLRSTKN